MSGCYKFLERQWNREKHYFECNFPGCTAKLHAIGEKGDTCDTLHLLGDGLGDVYVPECDLRLADSSREQICRTIFEDPIIACKEVHLNLSLQFKEGTKKLLIQMILYRFTGMLDL